MLNMYEKYPSLTSNRYSRYKDELKKALIFRRYFEYKMDCVTFYTEVILASFIDCFFFFICHFVLISFE